MENPRTIRNSHESNSSIRWTLILFFLQLLQWCWSCKRFTGINKSVFFFPLPNNNANRARRWSQREREWIQSKEVKRGGRKVKGRKSTIVHLHSINNWPHTTLFPFNCDIAAQDHLHSLWGYRYLYFSCRLMSFYNIDYMM